MINEEKKEHWKQLIEEHEKSGLLYGVNKIKLKDQRIIIGIVASF